MFWTITSYLVVLASTLLSGPSVPTTNTGQPNTQSNVTQPAPAQIIDPRCNQLAPSGRAPGCNHNETLVSDSDD
ncbi:MAG TPA: hypothetical protein VFD58_02515 [Blastocatellia bacterium]|nr:hypothetical protein [Blastocatellia bacterium]